VGAERRERSREILYIRSLWVLPALFLGLGCAEKQPYWTRGGAGENEFRRVSRTCNEAAQIQVRAALQRAPGLPEAQRLDAELRGVD